MFAARRPWTLIAPVLTIAALALVAVLLALAKGSGRSSGLAVSAHGNRGAPTGPGPGSTPPGSIAGSTARPTLLAARRPTGTPVSVAVAARAAGPATPGDFLGLSFELRSLPLIAANATDWGHRPQSQSSEASSQNQSSEAPSQSRGSGAPSQSQDSEAPAENQGSRTSPPPAAGGDLVALLRSLGPGVLRFGGVSADEQTAWIAGRSSSGGAALPRWAGTAITAHDLEGIAALARAIGWRVLLTVNLGHYDPAAAAQEAAAARAALGPYLAGVELGNEPDRYVRKQLRAPGWGFAAYRPQAAAYRAAIATAAPGVPIAGPDPSSGVPGLAWLRAAAGTLRPDLLTDHYYPLSSCGARPTISELLSLSVRRAESAMLAAIAALARAAHAAAPRVDETNSISCEGQPGVSNTFAAALWALDYTARALTAGVAGVNFHDLIAKPGAYSPLVAPNSVALAAGALRATPEWYALLAARQLPGAQPLPASVAGAAPGELDASAFRAPDGRLRLVLVDYDPPGSPPLAVRLRVPRAAVGVGRRQGSVSRGHSGDPSGYASGSVLRLTAPSPAATAGVTLGGRAVAPDGSWTPPAALPAVYARSGSLAVQMPPSSAAVVTLYPG